MMCPQCETPLAVAERQGVEIDHCPTCRGVWLDRGELDKLIERSNAYTHDEDEYPDADPRYGQPHPPQPGYPPGPPHAPYAQQPPRRKSFWSELFD